MQIIPTDTTDFALDLWSSMGNQLGSDLSSDFMQTMQSAMSAVESGEEVSVSTALHNDSDQSQPLAEAPYSRSSTDGVTYTLDEVCFTKQELHELRDQLVKNGAPEESLKQFDVLAGQPDGATLGQVIVSLRSKGKGVTLSEEDEHTITALLGKLDPTGDLAAAALQSMHEGKGEAALAMISKAFGNMSSADGIEISLDEALALGRGLGLNKNSMESLAGSFGGHAALRLSGSQFAGLMTPASEQFMTERANLQKLDAALEQALKPIISKARDRMEKEKAASALSNLKVEQSRVMIDKTVQSQSRAILEQTLRSGHHEGEAEADANAHSEAISRKLNGRQSGAVGEAGGAENRNDLSDKLGRASSNTDRARNAMPEGTPLAESAQAAGKDGSKNGSDAPGFENNGQSKGKEWNELLGKIETRSTPPPSNNGNSIVFSMLQGGQNIPETTSLQNGAQSQRLAPQVAHQVEQGLLSTLKGGGSRLDLQLHPQELGAITLTLTSRNGEVSARIRSERSETAEIVTRQLDAIRANLEQQGIKVDKIEVQLQNQQGEDGPHWQNLDQHNSRQEEDARREELARLKNLATMRNNEKNEEIETLEQPMHSLSQTARYATRSLHVVA